jgi:hypothetical protein
MWVSLFRHGHPKAEPSYVLYRNEKVTAIIAPEPTIDVVYLILQTTSTSTVRKYNVTYDIRTTVTTRQNVTEIDNGNGNLTQINHGDYNETTVDIIPSVARFASSETTPLPLLHSGIWDNTNNVGYVISNAATSPALCKLDSNATLLGCIDLVDAGAPIKLHVDPQAKLVYLVTSAEKIVRVDISVADLTNATYNVATIATTTNILAAVFDTEVTNHVYLSVATTPGSIVRFDLNAWALSSNYSVSVPRFTAARAGAIDREHGFIYFASFSNPSLIAKFNALTGELVGSHTVLGTYSRATQLTFGGGEGRNLFLVDFSNVVYVQAPSPCPSFCSGKGICEFGGECNCIAGWQDDDCNALVCNSAMPSNNSVATYPDSQVALQCAGVGSCRNGTCQCYPGYEGENCTTFLCPGGCNGRGTCDTATHTCSCDRGYEGISCEFALSYLPCEQASNCSECSLNPGCVWCASTSTCLIGDIEGPSTTFCDDFHYQYCPEVAYYVIPAILTVIWCLMVVNNIVAAVREDLAGEPAPSEKANATRSAWWRTVRSANTWGMLETFQYVGLFATLGFGGIPTYFLQYCRVYLWSLVGVRPIWETPYIFDAPLEVAAKRGLLSWIQSAHYYGTSPALIVIGVLIILLIFLVAMAIVRVILIFVKKPAWDDRWVYAVFRILIFFQIPIVASGGAAIVHAIRFSTDYVGLAFGFVGVVAYLGASIFALIYFIRLNPKLIFLPVYRRRLASLIAPYDYKKLWFVGLFLLKRTIIAGAFGFLASSSAPAALGIAIGAIVIYAICVIVFKVYMEMTSLIADIIISALQIILLGLCFGIITSPTPVFTIVVLIVHAASILVGVATYFVHWMRYRNAFTLKQFCSCSSPNSSKRLRD